MTAAANTAPASGPLPASSTPQTRPSGNSRAGMLAHGDADELVPFDQSEKMYRALKRSGHRAHLIRVRNAPHEGSFWSGRLHEIIYQYLQETL